MPDDIRIGVVADVSQMQAQFTAALANVGQQLAVQKAQFQAVSAEVNKMAKAIIEAESQAAAAVIRGNQAQVASFNDLANQRRAALSGLIEQQSRVQVAMQTLKAEMSALNASIRSTAVGMEGLGAAGVVAVSGMKVAAEGAQYFARETTKGRFTAQMLGTELNLGVPRAMASILAASPVMGAALRAALPVAVAIGMAEVLGRLVKEVYNLGEAWSGVARSKEIIVETTAEIDRQRLAILKADEAHQNLNLIGVAGARKFAVEQHNVGNALSDVGNRLHNARIEAGNLENEFNKLKDSGKTLEENLRAGSQSTAVPILGPIGLAGATIASFATLASRTKEVEVALKEKKEAVKELEGAYHQLRESMEKLPKEEADEIRKEAEKTAQARISAEEKTGTGLIASRIRTIHEMRTAGEISESAEEAALRNAANEKLNIEKAAAAARIAILKEQAATGLNTLPEQIAINEHVEAAEREHQDTLTSIFYNGIRQRISVLREGDQEGLADLKADHKVSAHEEVEYWDERIKIHQEGWDEIHRLERNPPTGTSASGLTGFNAPLLPGNLPAFAKGGLVDQPTVILAGEAGPEVIIPVDQLQRFITSQFTPGGNIKLPAGSHDVSLSPLTAFGATFPMLNEAIGSLVDTPAFHELAKKYPGGMFGMLHRSFGSGRAQEKGFSGVSEEVSKTDPGLIAGFNIPESARLMQPGWWKYLHESEETAQGIKGATKVGAQAPTHIAWANHPSQGVIFNPLETEHTAWFEQIGLPSHGKGFDKIERGMVEVDHKGKTVTVFDYSEGTAPSSVASQLETKYPQLANYKWEDHSLDWLVNQVQKGGRLTPTSNIGAEFDKEFGAAANPYTEDRFRYVVRTGGKAPGETAFPTEERTPPKYLYHGTSTTHLPDIQRDGIMPSPTHSGEYLSFLTTDIKLAKSRAIDQVGKAGGSPVVLRVDTNSPSLRGITVEGTPTGGMESKVPIPPSAISESNVKFNKEPLSDLPKLAEGGVVTGPTPLIAGDKGAEAILPLTSIDLARNVLTAMGIDIHFLATKAAGVPIAPPPPAGTLTTQTAARGVVGRSEEQKDMAAAYQARAEAHQREIQEADRKATEAAREGMERMKETRHVSIAEEADYWRNIRDTAKAGGDNYTQLLKLSEREYSIAAAKLIEERKKVQQLQEQQELAHNEAMLKMQEEIVTQGSELGMHRPAMQAGGISGESTGAAANVGAVIVSLGAIQSEESRIQAEVTKFHQQMYAEELASVRRLEEAHKNEPLVSQELKGKELQIQDKANQQALTDELKTVKLMEAEWNKFFTTFNQGFTHAIDQAIMGKEKFSVAMGQLYNQLVLQQINFAATWLLQEAERWIKAKILAGQRQAQMTVENAARVTQETLTQSKLTQASTAGDSARLIAAKAADEATTLSAAKMALSVTTTEAPVIKSNAAVAASFAAIATAAQSIGDISAGNAAAVIAANVAMAQSNAGAAGSFEFLEILVETGGDIVAAAAYGWAAYSAGEEFVPLAGFAQGGIVPNTGIALVHKGEEVVPGPTTEMVNRMAANGGNNGGGRGHTFHVTYAPTINGKMTKQDIDEHVNYLFNRMQQHTKTFNR